MNEMQFFLVISDGEKKNFTLYKKAHMSVVIFVKIKLLKYGCETLRLSIHRRIK